MGWWYVESRPYVGFMSGLIYPNLIESKLNPTWRGRGVQHHTYHKSALGPSKWPLNTAIFFLLSLIQKFFFLKKDFVCLEGWWWRAPSRQIGLTMKSRQILFFYLYVYIICLFNLQFQYQNLSNVAFSTFKQKDSS